MTEQTTTPKGLTVGHADHGLVNGHFTVIDWALTDWDRNSFIIKVITLPPNCASLECGLYGPAVGDEPIKEDEVIYEKRNNRPGPSRLIDRPTRIARKMVVVAGMGSDGPMVFTAYGTRADIAAPREWWDSSMKPSEAIEAAQFWAEHALAREGS